LPWDFWSENSFAGKGGGSFLNVRGGIIKLDRNQVGPSRNSSAMSGSQGMFKAGEGWRLLKNEAAGGNRLALSAKL